MGDVVDMDQWRWRHRRRHPSWPGPGGPGLPGGTPGAGRPYDHDDIDDEYPDYDDAA